MQPKTIFETKKDANQVIAIQVELNQFEKNNIYNLINRLKNYPIIGTKWVTKNLYN